MSHRESLQEYLQAGKRQAGQRKGNLKPKTQKAAETRADHAQLTRFGNLDLQKVLTPSHCQSQAVAPPDALFEQDQASKPLPAQVVKGGGTKGASSPFTTRLLKRAESSSPQAACDQDLSSNRPSSPFFLLSNLPPSGSSSAESSRKEASSVSTRIEEQTLSLISAFDKASIQESPDCTAGSSPGGSMKALTPNFPWTVGRDATSQDVAPLLEKSPITPSFFVKVEAGASPMSTSPAGSEEVARLCKSRQGHRETRRQHLEAQLGSSPPCHMKGAKGQTSPGAVKKPIAKTRQLISQATKEYLETHSSPFEEKTLAVQANTTTRAAEAVENPAQQSERCSSRTISKGCCITGHSGGTDQEDVRPVAGSELPRLCAPWNTANISFKQRCENLHSTERLEGSEPGLSRVLNPPNAWQQCPRSSAACGITSKQFNASNEGGNALDRNKQPVKGQFKPPQPSIPSLQVMHSAYGASAKFYRPFKKQLDALLFAKSANESIAATCPESEVPASAIVKCWVEELSGYNGYYRSFLAASLDTFWSKYKLLAAHARHCYEVIEQDKPCHLYFDLEYEKSSNLELQGDVLVEKLVAMTVKLVRDIWGLNLEREQIVELESSTDVKFSRHLIAKLPGYAFENNAAVGSLVHTLLGLPEAGELTVSKSRPEDPVQTFTSFVDSGVYTKNRHFRLPFSSKGGKKAILIPTHRFGGPAQSSQSLERQFSGSLVSVVEPDCKLLSLEMSRMNARGLIKDAGGVCNGSSTCTGTDLLNLHKTDIEDEYLEQRFAYEEVQRWAEAGKLFIEEAAMKLAGGAHAYVRSIVQCGSAGTVAYGMLGPGSHFCENIGRCHKSNHNFFVANFPEGVFCQKCYDPDCSNFRSAWMPLPDHLCPLRP